MMPIEAALGAPSLRSEAGFSWIDALSAGSAKSPIQATLYGERMTNDILLIENDERVRTLTLNRPDARNALSSELRNRFFSSLAHAEADDDVDVVILTGADPVFCAGLDLKELGGQSALPDISPRWPPMTKPVIGAINGAAVTGGLELALYCDVLIASERARFADTHARVGLLPTWGLSVRLPQKVGVGLARRMSLTGDYLSAADALRAGLVTEVVPHDRLLPTARQVAASIVGNNQRAVRALLASYHRIDDSQTGAGLWLEAAAARQFRPSGDDIAANREAVLQRGRAQVR
jgi:enoyl-CoA hydratase/carnithine racemase